MAAPLLPEEVQRQGVSVKKQSTNFILILSLISPNREYDTLFLANYATLRLRDELSRVNGVGEVTVFGTANYSMRVWLDPEKLKARGLTTQDVVAAIREQNVQVAAGQIGQPPALDGQVFQYTVSVLGRLSTAEQFENIIVRTSDGGRLTRLKDVARVELGAQTYDQYNENKGQPTANIGIYQLPGANALAVAEEVKAAMQRLSDSFPEGMTYEIPLDTTKFVEASIHEVYKTLFEAGDSRADRDRGVPAGLAGDARAGHHRPGHDHRCLRRHGRARIHRQHADPVRPGTRHRHRGRRRHRDRRKRGASHRRGDGSRSRRRSRPCPKCWDRSSASRWC